MIKVNVEINNKSWHKKLKNPRKYFNTKIDDGTYSSLIANTAWFDAINN